MAKPLPLGPSSVQVASVTVPGPGSVPDPFATPFHRRNNKGTIPLAPSIPSSLAPFLRLFFPPSCSRIAALRKPGVRIFCRHAPVPLLPRNQCPTVHPT